MDPTPGVSWFDVEHYGRVRLSGVPEVGRLLLAHGAGAGPEHVLMRSLTDALAEQGVQCAAIEFDYRARAREAGKPRPPPRVDQLISPFADWVALMPPDTWWGGRSMGGRVASQLATEQACPGLILCAYPFHPRGTPERTRLSHWPQLRCATHVFQGSRDPMGSREEVGGYPLPAHVAMHWLEEGDHDWRTPRNSAVTQSALITQAARGIVGSMIQA
ncbi:hypothetical protein BH688_01195 [Kushneria phosphatilytica]|nr:hypothetical protein BH688_01195 [Kushneria phosphatilytica]